jgi:hypothetical protein
VKLKKVRNDSVLASNHSPVHKRRDDELCGRRWHRRALSKRWICECDSRGHDSGPAAVCLPRRRTACVLCVSRARLSATQARVGARRRTSKESPPAIFVSCWKPPSRDLRDLQPCAGGKRDRNRTFGTSSDYSAEPHAAVTFARHPFACPLPRTTAGWPRSVHTGPTTRPRADA